MVAASPVPLAPRPPDGRAIEILNLVRGTFAEKGFDGASMQDLARAAGMSVGNFYRYFPSKAAIVEGLIAHDLAEMEQDFLTVIAAPDPLEALRRLLHLRIPEHQCSEDGQLWAEITAAAQRKPDVGATCQHMEFVIASFLTQVFAAHTGLTHAAALERFGAEAAYIILLFKSASMISSQPDPVQVRLTNLILRTMDNLLDEIASARPKG